MSLSTTKDILRKLIAEFPDLMEEAFGVKLPSNGKEDEGDDDEQEEEEEEEEEEEVRTSFHCTIATVYWMFKCMGIRTCRQCAVVQKC